MNYVDIIIAVILGIGFVKGFMKAFWSSVLAITGTVIGLVGAYFLTGPVVGYLEQTAGLVTQLSQKWADVFSLFPNYSKPYDPNSVAEFFQGIDSIEWLRPMSALIKDHFLQVEAIAGPGYLGSDTATSYISNSCCQHSVPFAYHSIEIAMVISSQNF